VTPRVSRLARARALLVATFVAGCTRAPTIRVEVASAIPHATVSYDSFGAAADDFAPAAARSLASTPDEHTYATALEHLLGGRLSDCANTVATLAHASDPALRGRALDLHEAVLMQLGAYRELGRVSKDPDARAVAKAFGEAPPQRLSFTPENVVIPATFSNAGSPMVDAVINRHAASLWIDSGASFSVLSSDIAERASVHPVAGVAAQATIGTAGASKQVDARLGVVELLRVGPLRGEHLPFVILPERDLSFKLLFFTFLKVEGILGWNLLRQIHATIDYPHASVRLRPSQKSAGERNLFWYSMPIAAATTADGKSFYLGVDTGARRSYLTPHGARKLRAISGDLVASSVSDVSFMLSGSAIYVSKMDVRSMPRAPPGLDGVLANDILSKGTLDLDSPAGRIDFAAKREDLPARTRAK
jgi:hypothetical protein